MTAESNSAVVGEVYKGRLVAPKPHDCGEDEKSGVLTRPALPQQQRKRDVEGARQNEQHSHEGYEVREAVRTRGALGGCIQDTQWGKEKWIEQSEAMHSCPSN
jgi:hypothetical protein